MGLHEQRGSGKAAESLCCWKFGSVATFFMLSSERRVEGRGELCQKLPLRKFPGEDAWGKAAVRQDSEQRMATLDWKTPEKSRKS